jgi:hypothetical protein
VTDDRSITVLAHGLGGSADLPIPHTYALIGAAWALTVTFAVVALAWKQPRFDPARPGRPLPRWVDTVVDAPVTRATVAGAALLFTGWVTMAAGWGPQDAENPLATTSPGCTCCSVGKVNECGHSSSSTYRRTSARAARWP